MNLDARSRRLNAETGFIIDSDELAQQEAARFEAMTRPENSHSLGLRPVAGKRESALIWHTIEDGEPVDYGHEPARSRWKRVQARVLAWLPLDPEL
jgi:putative cardiolipin synthase